MYVPSRAIPSIIGAKGAKAKEITDLSGARFDVDRVKEIVTLRGNQESCLKLKELIDEILEEEGFNHNEEIIVETVPVQKEVSGGKIISLVGASPADNEQAAQAAITRALELNMSKSAIRRKRRKEQDKLTDANGSKVTMENKNNEDCEEEENVIVRDTKEKISKNGKLAKSANDANVGKMEIDVSSILSNSSRQTDPSDTVSISSSVIGEAEASQTSGKTIKINAFLDLSNADSHVNTNTEY